MVAPADVIQDPYLEIINLSTSENLKLYNKEIFGLPESDRYNLTRSKLALGVAIRSASTMTAPSTHTPDF